VKKPETLRGRGAFRNVLASGTRIDGAFLRCSFRLGELEDAPLCVGFQVSAKKYNAVRRNRLKRLMREGFRHAQMPLNELLRQRQRGVSVVVMFKGNKEVPAERTRLHHLQKDMEKFCRAIAAGL
jgi:ribonuclease P protein component